MGTTTGGTSECRLAVHCIVFQNRSPKEGTPKFSHEFENCGSVVIKPQFYLTFQQPFEQCHSLFGFPLVQMGAI